MTAATPDRETRDDATTLSDEEWPVAEQYRVGPLPDDPETRSDEPETRVIERRPRGRIPRRVPAWFQDIGLRALVVAAIAVLLAATAAWYVTKGEAEAESAPPPRDPPALTNDLETTPTAPKPVAAKKVPDVTNATVEEARQALAEAGLRVRIREVGSEELPAGHVIRQSPPSGSEISKNGLVVLSVSTLPEQIEVPGVIGERVSAAVRVLRDAGLAPKLDQVESSEPAGTVLAQAPASGTNVDRGTVVHVRVAKPRPAPVTVDVPELVGSTVSTARARLRGLGLRSTVSETESSEPRGSVIEQSPAAGASLRKGEAVRLTVSSGPATMAIPDVVGVDEQTASQQLEAAGFEVTVVDEPTEDPSQDGVVVGQSPSAGAQRSEGTVVTLRVARLG